MALCELGLSLAPWTYWLSAHCAAGLGAWDDHTDSPVGVWGGLDMGQCCQGVLSPAGHASPLGQCVTTVLCSKPRFRLLFFTSLLATENRQQEILCDKKGRSGFALSGAIVTVTLTEAGCILGVERMASLVLVAM